MCQTGEILIVVLDVEGGDLLIDIQLQFVGKNGGVLGGENLGGDGDVVDIFFCQQGGMGGGDGVDKGVACAREVIT